MASRETHTTVHPDIETIALHMFRRQMAGYDLIEAMADVEWERDADIRAFWIGEAAHVVRLLRPWLHDDGEGPAAA